MKKELLICMMILGVLSSFAQIPTPVPNSGFENWVTVGGHQVPCDWRVRDNTASRTTDKYAGNYAIKLLTNIIPGDTSEGTLEALPPDSTEGFNPAFVVTKRHSTLNVFYKFFPVNGDSCQFIVFLYKHGYVNPQSFNLVGGAWTSKGASSAYTPLSLPINYFDSLSTVPDSAFIAISAFKGLNFTTGKELSPLGNSALYVDNISFDGFITGTNNIPDKIKNVTIYPNPASDLMNIDMTLEESDYNISMYDMNGRLIKTIADGKLLNRRQISVDVEDIPQGDYILMI